ncbi:MAG: hypothetical protein L0Y64_22075 [Myxococcaceae bacterium]|nr:hypothetical protein [Myxococcaceae bacterium]
MRKNSLSLVLVLAGLSLGGTVGCGSDTVTPTPVTPTPTTTAPKPLATGLSYTDPKSTEGWRLVKDPSSTPTRLVLNLVGRAGTKSRGVGFNLQASPGVKFGAFDNGLPIHDTGVYQLLSVADDPNEPVALMGGVKKGNLLTVGIYQKDRARDAKESGQALLQIAIEFDPAAQLKVGDGVGLFIKKAGAIPEDIGSPTDDLWTLDQKLKLTPIFLQVGTLTAG